MPSIMEQAAATIAALGTDAAGCDCTYHPISGGSVALKAQVTARTVVDAAPGRGTPGPSSRRMAVFVTIERVQAGVEKVAKLAAGDMLDVPGKKVGKPAQATVKLRVARDGLLIHDGYWTGELAP